MRLAAALWLCGLLAGAGRHRLLVLTDISSLTSGVREPDDGQSLIRLLLFANDIEIEGLVASSNMRHGQVARPELIREAISAYAQVWPNLLGHDRRYPAPEALLRLVKAGQPAAGPAAPVELSVGNGKDTEGSEWILKAALRKDARPLWIAIWGGSADLAQALWKARATMSAPAYAKLLAGIRVHAIGDQDSTGVWIKREFPGLFYITRGLAIRGMYRGGDERLTSSSWVRSNVKQGYGALGALYPDYNGGDIWARQLGPVKGVKEGDTPSFLNLIPVGLGDDGMAGWGGRIAGGPLRFEDSRDEPGPAGDPAPEMKEVYQWREQYQAEFESRLDWCVKPYREANHAPVVRLRRTRRGARTVLDAGSSSDPDGGPLAFTWNCGRLVCAVNGPTASVESGNGWVTLQVRDSGSPALTRYWRGRVSATP